MKSVKWLPDVVKVPERTAVEEMRKMVRYFNCLNESFNDNFTHEALRKIWTFTQSEQGGRVHEYADCWPKYLLDAVLVAKVGEKLDEAIVERASKEAD